MRIPKRFKLKRSMWTVSFDTTKLDTKLYNGMCYLDKHQIFIDPALSRNEMEITFIHEYLHAIWPDGIVGSKIEEKLIDRLSKTLHRSLIDNGWIFTKRK